MESNQVLDDLHEEPTKRKNSLIFFTYMFHRVGRKDHRNDGGWVGLMEGYVM